MAREPDGDERPAGQGEESVTPSPDGEASDSRSERGSQQGPAADEAQPSESEINEKVTAGKIDLSKIDLSWIKQLADLANRQRSSSSVGLADRARVRGNVAGGDQINISLVTSGSRDEVRIATIDKMTLEEVISVYVPPAAHQQACDLLTRQRVLVLAGRAGQGKLAAALSLLGAVIEAGRTEAVADDAGQDPPPTRWLSPDLTRKQLLSFSFEAGGYVVHRVERDTIRLLGPFDLRALAGQLRERNAWLVLTVDDPDALSPGVFDAYGVTWRAPTDTRSVVSEHLKWGLAQRHARDGETARLLELPQVQDLLKERLWPSDAVHLARTLAQEGMEPSELSAELDRFRATRAYLRVRSWFHQHPPPWIRSFMVATAILNGLPYRLVVEGAQWLADLAGGAEGASDATPNGQLDGAPGEVRRLRPEEAMAHTELTLRDRRITEIVCLDDPYMQTAVLECAWQELMVPRAALLSWLEGLGRHEEPALRQGAIAAVGELAQMDFDHVMRNVILRWTDDDPDSMTLESAAGALEFAAWPAVHMRSAVYRVLREWRKSSNGARVRSAVIAYGGLLGARNPAGALRALRQVADHQAFLHQGYLRGSVVNLFEGEEIARQLGLATDRDSRTIVLTELLTWTASTAGRGLSWLGFGIFLSLAGYSSYRHPDGHTVPALLWLGSGHPQRRSVLAELWRRALDDRRSREPALRLLRDWVNDADRDPALGPKLVSLLDALLAASNRHERHRLLAHLRRWAGRRGERSATVARYLEHVEAEPMKEGFPHAAAATGG